MEIESVSHKALRRFIETNSARGLHGDLIDRIYKMVNFIISAEAMEELGTPPNYGLHALTGDRVGTWSMTVSRNWRMTFGIDEENRIIDLDLEDYH